jgi:hypothetical protein
MEPQDGGGLVAYRRPERWRRDHFNLSAQAQ